MRSGVFQAREIQAREGRLAHAGGQGEVHSLRPWSPSPARGAPRGRALGEGPRRSPWAAGDPLVGRPLLGLSSPQFLSSLSFVLRVLVGSELMNVLFLTRSAWLVPLKGG